MTDGISKTIRTYDCNIHVVDSGSGVPLLMLPDNVAGTAYSFRHLKRLLPHRRTIAMDFPGIGQSEQDPEYDQSLTHLANVVSEVADALDLQTYDLVGYGRGAGIARIVALSHSDRIRSLTLMTSIAYDNWPIMEMQAIGGMRDHMEQVGPMMPVLMPLFITALTNMYRSVDPNGVLCDQVLRKYMQHFLSPEGMATLVNICHDATPEELEPFQPRDIRLPTLILWGDRDNYFDAHWGERLYNDIPNSELALIKDAGFLLFEEQPEAIARTMERFLKRID